jgi:hypothetical protein
LLFHLGNAIICLRNTHMSTNFLALLPFLAALQRKPGTRQDQDESKPSPARANSGQIPLGGAPPPPGVPANAFDQARIRELRLDKVAGIIFNENRDVMPEPSTPEELRRAKAAQANAVINADRKYGVKRDKIAGTATWKVADHVKESAQFQQALGAARTAYQENSLGADPTGGAIFFNNRFEKDVGKNGEHLRDDRIIRDKQYRPVGRQRVKNVYGPFTVGGGKVWTLTYGPVEPVEPTKPAPAKKTGRPVPGGKIVK